MMNETTSRYTYSVTVDCATREQADAVIESRLGYFEEIDPEDGGPFPYVIRYENAAAPHACGVCDVDALLLDSVDERGHRWYRCINCGEGHTSQDCCE